MTVACGDFLALLRGRSHRRNSFPLRCASLPLRHGDESDDEVRCAHRLSPLRYSAPSRRASRSAHTPSQVGGLRGWGCAAGRSLWRWALCAHSAAMLVTGSRRGTRYARWCALRSNNHREPVNDARTCEPTLRLRFSPPQRSPRRTAPAAKPVSWRATVGIPTILRMPVCAEPGAPRWR